MAIHLSLLILGYIATASGYVTEPITQSSSRYATKPITQSSSRYATKPITQSLSQVTTHDLTNTTVNYDFLTCSMVTCLYPCSCGNTNGTECTCSPGSEVLVLYDDMTAEVLKPTHADGTVRIQFGDKKSRKAIIVRDNYQPCSQTVHCENIRECCVIQNNFQMMSPIKGTCVLRGASPDAKCSILPVFDSPFYTDFCPCDDGYSCLTVKELPNPNQKDKGVCKKGYIPSVN